MAPVHWLLALCLLLLPYRVDADPARRAQYVDPLGDLRLSPAFDVSWKLTQTPSQQVDAFVHAYRERFQDLENDFRRKSFRPRRPSRGEESVSIDLIEARSNVYLLQFLGRFFKVHTAMIEKDAVGKGREKGLEKVKKKRQMAGIPSAPPYSVLKVKRYRWVRAPGDRAPGKDRDCFGAWILYSNPRAKRAFGHRLGHLMVLWLQVPVALGEKVFLEKLAQLRRQVRFSEQSMDLFEKGNLFLPAFSFFATTRDDYAGFPCLKATWKAQLAGPGAIVSCIKSLAHVTRRNALDDKSFPSGHTAMAFSAAGSISQFHPKTRTSLLILSGLVGRSRVRSHHHRPIDILVGGAIGYATGRYFSRREIRDRRPNKGAAATLFKLHF